MTRRAWVGGILAAASLWGCGGRDAAPTRQLGLKQLEARVRTPGPRSLLLVFWATWCEPCVAEIPDLVVLQEQHADRLEILGVSLDAFLNTPARSDELVQALLAQRPVPYANILYVGAQDPLFDTFDLPGGIPYAVLYDRERRALRHFRGRVDPAWIDSVLTH